MLVENVSNVIKEWPTLSVWWKILILKSKSNSFQELIWASQVGLLKLLRSLEGGTRG